MKPLPRPIHILLLCALGVAAALLTSCAEMAGTTLSFDENGNLLLTPPTKPIIIEVDGRK